MPTTKFLLPYSIAIAILVGCSSQRVPVIERSRGQPDAMNAASTKNVPLAPVAAGYYRVKRGDTLYRIALEHGQSYRDVAQWNNLSNPDQIEVDQVLQVAPMNNGNAKVIVGGPINSHDITTKPLSPDAAKDGTTKDSSAADKQKENNKEVASDIRLNWPAIGHIVGTFDDVKNKGLDIAGKVGDPVKAAGDGKIVYAGNGLRGYGNLIIIKHNSTFLTAYAHNRSLIAKEGEQVKAGQKIAEMGNSDTDSVKLHFEVRRHGKPVDPMRYLPEKNS